MTNARVWCYVGIIVLLTGLSAILPYGKAESDLNSTLALSLPDGTVAELTFLAEPPLAGCQQVESGAIRQVWQCSGYAVELGIVQERSDLITFTLRSLDGNPFTLHEYSVRVVVPYPEGAALWTFNRLATTDIMETDLTCPWEFFSAPNRGIPYLALVDKQGLNKLALGLLAQDHVVFTSGELSDDHSSYAMTLRQADNASSEKFEDTFYVSRSSDAWFHNAQTYTALSDRSRGYVPSAPPAAATLPVYDSWYWTFDEIDQDLVWNLAVRSHDLGFGTYLIDAGWDTSPGEYFKWLDGSTGDYTPPRNTFPDFGGLVDDIQDQLGMKVMLWMQQYGLGRDSIYYPDFGASLSSVADSTGTLHETAALCPRVLSTHSHMADLFERVLTDYHPDAFWFDWQEDIPQNCSAQHLHDYASFGEGYNSAQKKITDTILQHTPDAFIDMRWPYANLNNKPYTHLWQPIDTAGDFEAMRLRAMVMRPFSAGILMGTDEMYWSPKLSDTDAARFMATVVFTGVPYFGPNLQAQPASQAEMLKAWLRFYNANRDDLVNGSFVPYGERDHPDQVIHGSQTSFVYYANHHRWPVQLVNARNKIYVANVSQSASIDLPLAGLVPGDYRVEISDLLLRNRGTPSIINLKQYARLKLDVPVGCLLTLTRNQS